MEPQANSLWNSQPEHEVSRETPSIPTDRSVDDDPDPIDAGLLISCGMDMVPSVNAAAAEERERDRVRRWQTERLRALADRIEAGEFVEASQVEIDAIFRT